ncbi:MAG: delta-60 repeat domain-containing protein [Solirubrobacterales bacterium]
MAALAPPSSAVPGELVGAPARFETRKGAEIDLLDGRPIFRLADGRYIAFADTARRVPFDAESELILEVRRLRVLRYSASGRLDRRFLRTPIGRGLRIGRREEVSVMRGFRRLQGDVFIAWVTTNGALFSQYAKQWPRSTLVAFNARTGRLIRSFGKRGVIVDGLPESIRTGRTTVEAVELLRDGRVLSCGDLGRLTSSPVPPNFRSVPLVTAVSLDSPSQQPFLDSGATTIEITPEQADLVHKSCRAVGEAPDGKVIVAGTQDRSSGGADVDLWIRAYNPNGSLDQAFGGSGETVVRLAVPQILRDTMDPNNVVVAPNGSIYISGSTDVRSPLGFVIRLDASGDLDPTFSSDGVVWVDKFYVDDATVLPTGDLFVTGHTRRDRAAAGWIDTSGQWNPNFNGTGRRYYRMAYSYDLYQLSSLGIAEIWDWIPARKPRCRCQGVTSMRIRNALDLDSSITKVGLGRNGDLAVKGLASSPTEIDRIEVGIGKPGKLPTTWIPATGSHSWSVRIPRSSLRGTLIYSRAVSKDGSSEQKFSQRDRNLATIPKAR